MTLAQAMGLVDYAEDSSLRSTDYSSMIQLFNRFLMEQFAVEIMPFESSILRDQKERVDQDPVTQLVGMRARTVTKCTNCGFQIEKSEVTRVVDLVYNKVRSFTTTSLICFAFV